MVNQQHADDVSIACIVQMYERIKFLESPTLPAITSKQALNLRKTWARFSKGDNDTAGLNMFLELFKLHPTTKAHFDFAATSAVTQMVSNSRMLFHVSRVAWYIQQVLENLDNLEDIVPQLKQVGGRHSPKGYNISPKTLPLLGEALVKCMKTTDTSFTTDDADTWKVVFQWIVDRMEEGMTQTKH